MYGAVYLVTNILNGKVYVGQTTRPSVRWGEHWYGSHKNPRSRLQYAIRKYGKNNFEFSVVAEARSQPQLDDLERLWIICLNTRDKKLGYNLTSGGEHFTHSEETRAKIAAANVGRKYGDRKGPNNSFYGRHHTPEAKARLSKTHSIKHGRPMPPHVKEAITRGFREKGAAKVRALCKARIGKIVVSEETRQRMSDSFKRYRSEHPEEFARRYESMRKT